MAHSIQQTIFQRIANMISDEPDKVLEAITISHRVLDNVNRAILLRNACIISTVIFSIIFTFTYTILPSSMIVFSAYVITTTLLTTVSLDLFLLLVKKITNKVSVNVPHLRIRGGEYLGDLYMMNYYSYEHLPPPPKENSIAAQRRYLATVEVDRYVTQIQEDLGRLAAR